MIKKSIQEIKESSKDKQDSYPFLRGIRLILGYNLTWLAIRMRLLPLHVTYFNLFLGFMICIMFAWLDPVYRIVAALLLVFWQAMDTVDGNMARTLKIRSNYGGFVDEIGGLILLAFIQFSICVGLYRFPEGSITIIDSYAGLSFSLHPEYFLIIGGFGSISTILSRLINRIIIIRFGVTPTKSVGIAGTDKFLFNNMVSVFRNIESFGGFQIPLIFLASIFNLLSLLVIFYFLISIILLMGYSMKMFYSLRNRHDYLY